MTRYHHSWDKERNLATWNSFPELTDSFMTLTTTPVSIQDDKMNCFERFLVLPYSRTGQHLEVHKAGKKLFTKRDSVQRIAPTFDALLTSELDVKRSVFQGGYIWRQTLVTLSTIPSPASWGWRQTESGSYEPTWTTLVILNRVARLSIGCQYVSKEEQALTHSTTCKFFSINLSINASLFKLI